MSRGCEITRSIFHGQYLYTHFFSKFSYESISRTTICMIIAATREIPTVIMLPTEQKSSLLI